MSRNVPGKPSLQSHLHVCNVLQPSRLGYIAVSIKREQLGWNLKGLRPRANLKRRKYENQRKESRNLLSNSMLILCTMLISLFRPDVFLSVLHLQTNQERSAGLSPRNPPDPHWPPLFFSGEGAFLPKWTLFLNWCEELYAACVVFLSFLLSFFSSFFLSFFLRICNVGHTLLGGFTDVWTKHVFNLGPHLQLFSVFYAPARC